ncbi:hypothetical protein CERSUDRAFT_126127 [Gelatoporia subvermispora B]|uniref:Uncharacterized protein n=1 Tax=Ceriporiopsis subvermispora (strain B) TaxID=914234 RepID=M2QMH9_CERS8|nr:hypothetical protein CERSUDRAFT_126127 [Gelatoporia subvermispora B]
MLSFCCCYGWRSGNAVGLRHILCGSASNCYMLDALEIALDAGIFPPIRQGLHSPKTIRDLSMRAPRIVQSSRRYLPAPVNSRLIGLASCLEICSGLHCSQHGANRLRLPRWGHRKDQLEQQQQQQHLQLAIQHIRPGLGIASAAARCGCTGAQEQTKSIRTDSSGESGEAERAARARGSAELGRYFGVCARAGGAQSLHVDLHKRRYRRNGLQCTY